MAYERKKLRPNKTYKGVRLPDDTTEVTVNGEPLDLRLDVCNHSPTGFEWGYQGSGPAQLALAILIDHYDFLDDPVEAAQEHYQEFKRRAIAVLPRDSDWEMTADQVGFIVSTILNDNDPEVKMWAEHAKKTRQQWFKDNS